MRVRVCVLFAVLLLALLSVAQVNMGVISGTVRDNAGAVVAGATVTAKNVDTTFERTVQTNSSGSYIMPRHAARHLRGHDYQPGLLDLQAKNSGYGRRTEGFRFD